MDNITYLLVANVVVWLGVGGYLMFMFKAHKTLERRMARLEALRDGDGN